MALENPSPAPACGRTANRVWHEIGRPPDLHTRSCPDCRQARSSLEALYTATVSLRDHDLSHPAFRPPRGLKDAIIDVACAQVRRGVLLPVAATADGTVEVSELALAAVVRDAASTVGGVRARRCRIDLTPDAAAGLRIHLRTAVAPGVDICRAMDFLRRNIRSAVAASVGIIPHTVHLTVEDLYDD
ncbi:hypothetical protein QNO08_16425 [Arthrobacter sp. zg-Y820]|uniref:hypothetical protein n=1 Tax=unclassified Arthrobacter TaxID=235627 RepID=UPI001E29FD95|nr:MULTISPECIES: hypothetical protein [unclassified Arthrobacter]MCC9197224.1 hypothetical protein [Arthrobacter sp. zg-Y820]MDK1280089.1 hypothetical protein [Arthrobacter sp. zg.Y820]MDK1360773.1 hypothetical protein [Arthrobacter sp. zg-Y1219]WIB09382.1 hypothetical protein QNO08_16425 [Arthrobacter sp. zg-Y820]